jgi:hypothetical protein
MGIIYVASLWQFSGNCQVQLQWVVAKTLCPLPAAASKVNEFKRELVGSSSWVLITILTCGLIVVVGI